MEGMNAHTNLYILFLSYSLHVRPYVVTTLDRVMHEFENIAHLQVQVGGYINDKGKKACHTDVAKYQKVYKERQAEKMLQCTRL